MVFLGILFNLIYATLIGFLLTDAHGALLYAAGSFWILHILATLVTMGSATTKK
jgi:hypothetical protein